MSSKIAEAQAHIDGPTVAKIILDFSTKYRNVYPKSVHISFAAVGPLQTLIGEAIQNGHLAVVGKGASDTRSVAEFHEPCPWNPFPRKSPWGRAIEEGYRKRIIAHRKEPTEEMIVAGEGMMDLVQPDAVGPNTKRSRMDEFRDGWCAAIRAAKDGG